MCQDEIMKWGEEKERKEHLLVSIHFYKLL